MPTYEITATAEGTARVTVEAANEEEAEQTAHDEYLHGTSTSYSDVSWVVDDITEIDGDAA